MMPSWRLASLPCCTRFDSLLRVEKSAFAADGAWCLWLLCDLAPFSFSLRVCVCMRVFCHGYMFDWSVSRPCILPRSMPLKGNGYEIMPLATCPQSLGNRFSNRTPPTSVRFA